MKRISRKNTEKIPTKWHFHRLRSSAETLAVVALMAFPRADAASEPLIEPTNITNAAESTVWQYHAEGGGVVGTASNHPIDEFFLFAGNLGDMTRVNPTWKVGDETGFYPEGALEPGNSVQTGNEDAIGRPALQASGSEVGFFFNSLHTVGQRDFLPNIRYGYKCSGRNKIHPWKTPSPDSKVAVQVSFEARMPHNKMSGGAVSYLPFSMALHDMSDPANPLIFTHNVKIFDSRGGFNRGAGRVGTGELTVRTPLENNAYVTNLASPFKTEAWKEHAEFQWQITDVQLLNAVNDLNEWLEKNEPKHPLFSTNPKDYRLRRISFGAEIATSSGGHGEIGGSVRNLRVSRHAQ